MNANRIHAAVLISAILLGLCAHAAAQSTPIALPPQPAQPAQRAQTAQPAQPVTPGEHKPMFICSNAGDMRFFYLHNVTQQNDANELYTAARQLLPAEVRSFFVPSQNAIALCGSPEQIVMAQKLIADLDRHNKKNYRITYTISEMDGARKVSSQNYSLVVFPGQESTLKQGSRVPVPTGALNDKNAVTQFSYIDVGMNFSASIDETVDGIRLRTSVEQSSVAEGKPGEPSLAPVVRQATYRGTSFLAPGKPLQLGSLDLADSTRHTNLEVLMEPLP